MSGALPVMLLTPSMHDEARGVALGGQQLVEVVGVLEAEALDRGAAGAGDLAAVVDRLVRAGVHEDRARGGEQRDHGHVDVRDRRQEQRVLGAEQRGQALLDLLVQRGAAEQARPARVRAPPVEVRGDRLDDLAVEVEPEVVARGEVGEPVVADPDHAAVDLVDDGVHHRMRGLELVEVAAGLQPVLDPRPAPGRGRVGRAQATEPWHVGSQVHARGYRTRSTDLEPGRSESTDGGRSGGASAAAPRLQVARGQHAGLQRLGHETRALLVLRQVLDAEALEERAQVRLHRVDAQMQLARDVLVGRRHRELVVLVRPCESDEHLALRRRQVAEREPLARDLGGLRVLGGGALVGDRRLPHADHVAVAQPVAAAHPLAVDERAVPRQAVVGDRPLAPDALELRVQARDLRIPRQAQLVRGSAPHAQPLAIAVQVEDLLLAPSPRNTRNGRPRRSASMRSRSSDGEALWALRGEGDPLI